ncbi:hypothetical protein Cst04h_08790 [Corynebacterium striatum]|uniref:Uncharacterized protein n=1 Tax=Corynebacterium striatum TaxID=43770 RepID=A0ABC9ZKK2_CORST|nr:hypothetical protein Cst04h_08790 [Corynebacterium striatum]
MPLTSLTHTKEIIAANLVDGTPPTARRSPPNTYPTPPPKLTTCSKARYTTSQDLTQHAASLFL